MKAGYIDEISNWTGLEGLSAADYHAAAARARKLHAEATTAGTPGAANCLGQSLSALATQNGGINRVAAALGYASVRALHDANLSLLRRCSRLIH
jgi:hypothetical protein